MIPEQAINELRKSKRFFFVADGGDENPSLVYGAVAPNSVDLIYLLLRAVQEAPQIGQVIIDAAKCLQGDRTNELLGMIGQLHEGGTKIDL